MPVIAGAAAIAVVVVIMLALRSGAGATWPELLENIAQGRVARLAISADHIEVLASPTSRGPRRYEVRFPGGRATPEDQAELSRQVQAWNKKADAAAEAGDQTATPIELVGVVPPPK